MVIWLRSNNVSHANHLEEIIFRISIPKRFRRTWRSDGLINYFAITTYLNEIPLLMQTFGLMIVATQAQVRNLASQWENDNVQVFLELISQ